MKNENEFSPSDNSCQVPPLLLTALLSGCGNQSSDTESEEDKAPPLTAATLGEQQVLSISEYLAQPRYADADRRNGESQAQICRACHSFDEGGPNMVGPGFVRVLRTVSWRSGRVQLLAGDEQREFCLDASSA